MRTRPHPIVTGIAALIFSPFLLAAALLYVVFYIGSVVILWAGAVAFRIKTRRR